MVLYIIMSLIKQNKPIRRSLNDSTDKQFNDIYRSHSQLWNKVRDISGQVNDVKKIIETDSGVTLNRILAYLNRMNDTIGDLDGEYHFKAHSMHDAASHSNVSGIPNDGDILEYNNTTSTWDTTHGLIEVYEVVVVTQQNQVSFTLSDTPVDTSTLRMVPVKGIEQVKDSDFSVAANIVSYLASSPSFNIGDEIIFKYFK